MYYNHGKAMAIYETQSTYMDGCLCPNSVTPANIQSGFRFMGIHPFNESVFTDNAFLSPRTGITDGGK